MVEGGAAATARRSVQAAAHFGCHRGVLDTGQTPSKQPGHCCPVGCQVPETLALGVAERGRLAAE